MLTFEVTMERKNSTVSSCIRNGWKLGESNGYYKWFGDDQIEVPEEVVAKGSSISDDFVRSGIFVDRDATGRLRILESDDDTAALVIVRILGIRTIRQFEYNKVELLDVNREKRPARAGRARLQFASLLVMHPGDSITMARALTRRKLRLRLDFKHLKVLRSEASILHFKGDKLIAFLAENQISPDSFALETSGSRVLAPVQECDLELRQAKQIAVQRRGTTSALNNLLEVLGCLSLLRTTSQKKTAGGSTRHWREPTQPGAP